MNTIETLKEQKRNLMNDYAELCNKIKEIQESLNNLDVNIFNLEEESKPRTFEILIDAPYTYISSLELAYNCSRERAIERVRIAKRLAELLATDKQEFTRKELGLKVNWYSTLSSSESTSSQEFAEHYNNNINVKYRYGCERIAIAPSRIEVITVPNVRIYDTKKHEWVTKDIESYKYFYSRETLNDIVNTFKNMINRDKEQIEREIKRESNRLEYTKQLYTLMN